MDQCQTWNVKDEFKCYFCQKILKWEERFGISYPKSGYKKACKFEKLETNEYYECCSDSKCIELFVQIKIQ